MTKNNDTKTITPKELAQELETDPKTVRKFLRSISSERPNKGGRWAIPTEMVPELKERFASFGSRGATVLTLDDED